MLPRVLALVALLLLPTLLYAAESTPGAAESDHEFDTESTIDVVTVSRSQTENLVLLAEVWGFLKYHHQRVTAGEINWDYELFRVMPAVLDARDRAEAQKALSDWVTRIGVSTLCTTCAQLPDSIQLRPNLGWIHNRRLLGKALSHQLEAIYRDRSTAATQWYVSFYGDGNARFDNERSYENMAFPDPGYRLLGLFRYWCAVEYWFPYRDLIDGDWDDVLREFVPRFVSAKNENDYVLDVAALAACTHDGHAGVPAAIEQRPPVGDCRLPVSVRYVEGRFVVQAYADAELGKASGLLRGDSIISLDGVSVDKLMRMMSPYYSASNEAWRRHAMSFSLSNGAAGPCQVTIERNGTIMNVVASREPRNKMAVWTGAAHDLPGPTFRKLSEHVGYLWYGILKPEEVTSCIRQALGTRCLLIDVRSYPNDFAAFDLGAHLVTKPTPHSCFTHPDSTNPGTFVWTHPEALLPAEPHYEGKVAVLVDETTLSSAEYSALVLRACPQAIIVGSTTAGADGNVSTVPLPGGLSAKMSGIGVFYPDHSPTQRIGIVPDLIVHTTIAGIREGRDEVAEAAVRHLTGKNITIRAR